MLEENQVFVFSLVFFKSFNICVGFVFKKKTTVLWLNVHLPVLCSVSLCKHTHTCVQCSAAVLSEGQLTLLILHIFDDFPLVLYDTTAPVIYLTLRCTLQTSAFSLLPFVSFCIFLNLFSPWISFPGLCSGCGDLPLHHPVWAPAESTAAQWNRTHLLAGLCTHT